MKTRTALLTAVIAAAAITLSGCGTIAGGKSTIEPRAETGGVCKPDGLESFVGKTATTEMGTDIAIRSGALRLRWLPPRTAVTMEFRQDRVNVAFDDNMIITQVNCG